MRTLPSIHSGQLRPQRDTDSVSPIPPPRQLQKRPSLWQWWTTLTGPRAETFEIGIEAQERLRRARLVSALMPLSFLASGLLIPSALSFPLLWTTVIALVGGTLVVAVLNRVGRTNLSALLYVVLVDGAIGVFLLLKPALSAGNLSDFDLFILAVLVGGMILPRLFIPWIGMLQVIIIVSLFVFRPHDASLMQLIHSEGGNPYTSIAGLIVLQLMGAGIAWLQSWSVEQALLRASRAEELSEARAALESQAYAISIQKRHLEEGIIQILDIHRQIAMGNLSARVPMQDEHELWQIGHSLNTFLRRFQQQAQEHVQERAALQEIEQIIRAYQAAKVGAPLPPLRCNTLWGQHLLRVLEM